MESAFHECIMIGDSVLLNMKIGMKLIHTQHSKLLAYLHKRTFVSHVIFPIFSG